MVRVCVADDTLLIQLITSYFKHICTYSVVYCLLGHLVIPIGVLRWL